MEEIIKQTIWQKALLIFAYGLILLMIIFSIMAITGKGRDYFDKCIQEKCGRSDEHCNKAREIYNCCKGAGGELTSKNGGPRCAFP